MIRPRKAIDVIDKKDLKISQLRILISTLEDANQLFADKVKTLNMQIENLQKELDTYKSLRFKLVPVEGEEE